MELYNYDFNNSSSKNKNDNNIGLFSKKRKLNDGFNYQNRFNDDIHKSYSMAQNTSFIFKEKISQKIIENKEKVKNMISSYFDEYSKSSDGISFSQEGSTENNKLNEFFSIINKNKNLFEFELNNELNNIKP
ncbi:hypothetical protein H8356DRAFT_975653 [Neocallimastix lanati (nom. inval.)]|uniref:Uncharacterized protein n=1 Tax=Neocallimastix californiae TaxID=1754190 RepID=A0A1Y2EYY4_9FUNG|nr:hypothetical protein H8356DRAFT_975653 [Neocallimastix sp. JGI-2020a]ORY76842.1 hypothetical protein LY90DRAFT_698757 [Neocallimastix californiae]|eukprot:ORY76842.1 hypothetical protein LY90DRAFT_698757 [Neocallimastix californiae]